MPNPNTAVAATWGSPMRYFEAGDLVFASARLENRSQVSAGGRPARVKASQLLFEDVVQPVELDLVFEARVMSVQ
jgi:hypothetical protein